MTNYKSFKERTIVHLNNNVNVIVGKNGSGKSNLISAIQLIVCCPKIDPNERQNFIHEGSQEPCEVEIAFDNTSQRYHGPKEFTIRRCISPTKDEFYVDNKLATLEEVKGIFESSGIPVGSPYFLVLQGKINSIAVMTDKQRHSLIKNVAGIAKYEEDREKSLEMLEETKHTQSKVESILNRITDKLGGLERDKRQLEECEALENEKRRCEMAFTQREIVEINEALKELETEAIEEAEDSEEVEDLEIQIREVRKEIEEVVRKASEHSNTGEKAKAAEAKLLEVTAQLQNYLNRKFKLDSIHEGVLTELQVLKTIKDKSAPGEAFQRPPLQNPPEQKPVDFSSLKELVEKRNELWRKEKKLNEDLKGVEEDLKVTGTKMTLNCGGSQDLMRNDRVLDLFDIPEDLMPPFEAIAESFLFYIVVEDEGVVSGFGRGGLNFIPLNRMFYEEQKGSAEFEDLILLSSKIKINEKYLKYEDKLKDLLLYLTKDSFVASDLKTANSFSKAYNLNVVTLEGDVFNKSGVIVGGYERKKTVLLDYKRFVKRKEGLERKLGEVRNEISQINSKIDLINSLPQDKSIKINEKIFIELYEKEKNEF